MIPKIRDPFLECNISYIYVNLSLHVYSYLLFHVYPGIKSIHVLISKFSLSEECHVTPVCINPMNKYRIFVNYAFIVINV